MNCRKRDERNLAAVLNFSTACWATFRVQNLAESAVCAAENKVTILLHPTILVLPGIAWLIGGLPLNSNYDDAVRHCFQKGNLVSSTR